jgi:hypothetical protein
MSVLVVGWVGFADWERVFFGLGFGLLVGMGMWATCLGLGFEAVPGGGEDFAVVVGEGVGGHCCGLSLGLSRVGWLVKGLGGVGECMLYEGWFEVEGWGCVVSLGEEVGA